MAPPPPSPAKRATTVLDLDDDLLREVFLRLPALPSLVRAAFACRTFLRAVRSSPAFRRRFQDLHPSPFVGLFIQRLVKGFEPEVSSFDAHHHPSDDLDFAAAVRGGDFSLAALPLPDDDFQIQDRGDEGNIEEDEENIEEEKEEDNEEEEENIEEGEENSEEEEDDDEEDENIEEEEEDEIMEEEEEDEDASPVWEIERCCDGYVVLFNRKAKQIAAYNPLTRALHLLPSPPRVFSNAWNFEFHMIPSQSQEDPGSPIRIVCFLTCFFQALVGVISSDISAESEWQKFPEAAMGVTGKMVNGSVYWTHAGKPYMTVLDTATMQFTKRDLPPLLADQDGRECAFVLGNTKDGRPCIVSPGLWWADCSLNVYFWRREDGRFDDGLNYWILDQSFQLKTIRQFIKFSEGDDEFVNVRVMDLVDGVVFLRTEYEGYTEAPQMLLSFCLETAELKMICEDYHKPIHPYVMAWPPSLVQQDKGTCSKDQALSTPRSDGSDVKARDGLTEPASVSKA